MTGASAAPLGRLRTTRSLTRDGEDAVVRLEVPGVSTDDIDVGVSAGGLVIRGEPRERTEETDGRHLREIRYGSFERSFALPSHVTAEDVSA
ncbi:MAG TPA: Hsp20/alpha crystallin family protein, partial [Marmoricola sp.]